jgi:hypothetical protein
MNKSRLDLRTKPTVEDGLKLFEEEVTRSMVVDYQPGNGTRYCLSIVDTRGFSDDANHWMGFEKGATGWIVTDLNARRAMVVNGDGFLAAGYIMEKLGCYESDAYVLAELLGKLLGREYEEAGP